MKSKVTFLIDAVPPTGIIRTLPTLYDKSGKAKDLFEATMSLVSKGYQDKFFVTMQAVPKIEVVHMYILVEGLIRVRANIAGYVEGEEIKCWDGTKRTSKYLAICTAPISYPPEPVPRKGFQGFRYTQNLW